MKKIVLMLVFVLAAVSANALTISDADVYLDFEGETGGLGAECWDNKGTTGTGESTSRAGTDTIPVVNSSGLKGQGFDSSHLTPLTAESTYMYGNFGTTPGSDTALEETFMDIESFTFTGWVKTDTSTTNNPQGRLFTTYILEVNYIQGDIGQSTQAGRLAVEVGNAGFQNTKNDYASPDEWIFIGITYDGTKSADNLLCYVGSETSAVELSTTLTADEGVLERSSHGGNLWLGNVANYSSGNRPFVGYMDELRWFSSKSGSGSVLSSSDLENVRQYDLIPEPLTLSLLGFGTFFIRRRK